MNNLFSERISQLEKEKIQDEKLKMLYEKCPRETFDFLMKIREINREKSIKIYRSSFFDFYKNLEIGLSDYDKFLNSNLQCNYLLNLINKF